MTPLMTPPLILSLMTDLHPHMSVRPSLVEGYASPHTLPFSINDEQPTINNQQPQAIKRTLTQQCPSLRSIDHKNSSRLIDSSTHSSYCENGCKRRKGKKINQQIEHHHPNEASESMMTSSSSSHPPSYNTSTGRHWSSSPIIWLVVLLVGLQTNPIGAFVQQQHVDVTNTLQYSSSASSSRLYYSYHKPPKTNVKIPLLDWIQYEQEVSQQQNGDVENFLLPLPSSQLPNELSTPFLYGIQLERPIDKLIMEEAKTIYYSTKDKSSDSDSEEEEPEPSGLPSFGASMSSNRPIFGRLVWKNNKDGDDSSLVGAIGCTGEIVLNSPMDEILQGMDLDLLEGAGGGSSTAPPPSDTPPTTMLCRGGFRFVVKSVVQSIPYPIVIVDELEDDDGDDDETMSSSSETDNDDDDDDDDDDDEYLDDYDSMPAEELIHKIMSNVQKLISQKVDDASSKERSLLEQSILENTNPDSSKVPLDMTTIEQYQAEEMAAVWEIFQSSFVDDIEPSQRRFVLSMMAAELASLDNLARTKLLTTTNSLERLRYLAGKLDEAWGMQQARKLASQITDTTDEDEKDLKVGLPTLPEWAKTIHKGSRVEYYWNEEYDWVAGEVIEEPTLQGGAFDEMEVMMITIRFDDGEIHTIPLTGEDKARWRPEE